MSDERIRNNEHEGNNNAPVSPVQSSTGLPFVEPPSDDSEETLPPADEEAFVLKDDYIAGLPDAPPVAEEAVATSDDIQAETLAEALDEKIEELEECFQLSGFESESQPVKPAAAEELGPAAIDVGAACMPPIEETEQPVEALAEEQLEPAAISVGAAYMPPSEESQQPVAVVAEALPQAAPEAAPESAPSAAPAETAKAEAIDHQQKFQDIINAPQAQIGGIEILIQMADKGEIDAKNIDIMDVCDRFLKAISAVPKENLRQSGKIIFQASVLLRMKAEALLAAKVEDEFGFGDDFLDFDENGSPIIYDANHQPIARQITLADLERALVRQTKLRQMRHRRVTLEQLIEALREAERLEASRDERKIKPRIAIEGYNEMHDMDDLLELAHDEDIEDVIARIERTLLDLFRAEDFLPLLRIIECLGGRGDWVDAFLAVLFLSNAGKINLQQEQFYGPLFITRGALEGQMFLVPPAMSGSESELSH